MQESRASGAPERTRDVLDVARRALEIEGNAVLSLGKHLGESFLKTVDAIFESRGRVIITGMGKSGHIARKIAASLSSTGTPSLFLHPAEGFHGDLGVITKDDVAIAISNSGGTSEILDLIPSIKEIGATIVAMTANKDSKLAGMSDIVLYLGEFEEADPYRLIPTTSTTVALALGDAITVALMVKRDFSPEHFAVFHPKGMLAKRLKLKVVDLLRGDETNPVLPEGATFQEALSTITKHMLGGVSIVDSDGRPVGIVDLRDVVEYSADVAAGRILLAWDLARFVEPLAVATPLSAAMEKIWRLDSALLPVVDPALGGKLVGGLARKDLLNAFDREMLRKRLLLTRFLVSRGREGGEQGVRPSEDYVMVEHPVPASMQGKSLADLDLPAGRRLLVVALRRGEGASAEELMPPPADVPLREGDRLVLLGHREQVNVFPG